MLRQERDNTWGRGYIPPASLLLGLGRFADVLRPANWLDHKVWPAAEGQRPETHMITVAVRPEFSIMARDMHSLLDLGLIRLQSNENGELSFYFEVKPLRLERGRFGARRGSAP